MACLDERGIVDFIEGRLAPDARLSVTDHIDSCDDCRRLIADAAETLLTTSSSSEAESIAPGAKVGRYLVLHAVGAGAMGAVWAAYDPELDRKVALKVLHERSGGAAAELRARLSREAQSLARLRHPNVVTVFDVGAFGEQVFLAMELVDGTTLGEWLRAEPRGVARILEVMIQAGRGLEAAHAAGIVHRDFKPENVLVGRDGTVRVTDFGLARAENGSAIPGENSPVRTLTETGALVGTPAYMAPEQMAAEPLDGRADVFSFAVTLYEALYGERPFAGDTLGALGDAVAEGRVRAATGAPVPAWLRKRVLRGLAARREDRWPALGEFIAALQHDPLRPWRRAALAVAALALVSLPAVAWRSQARVDSQLCRGAERKLAGVWDGARRSAVAAAFTASGRGFLFETVAAALDDYAQKWAAMHTEACEATRMRGEQSGELEDLRMQCLDDRKSELGALADLLAHADAAMVDKARDAASRLGRLDGCADARALTTVLKPPVDAARAKAVEESRAQIAAAKAMMSLGRYPDGLAQAKLAVETARRADWKPVEAEAQFILGALDNVNSDLKGSEAALKEAVWAGEAGRHDALVARAWGTMMYVVGAQASRAADIPAVDRSLQAAIARMGGSAELEAARENHLGTLATRLGNSREAEEHMRRALAGFERALGPEDPQVARVLANLTLVLMNQSRVEEALQMADRDLVLFEKIEGKDHPEVAVVLERKVELLGQLGRHDEALAAAQRSLHIREQALGPNHPDVSYALSGLGNALRGVGRNEEARAAHARELELVVKQLGPDDPDVAGVLDELGTDERNLNLLARALATFQHALAIRQKAAQLDPRDLGSSFYNVGEVERRLKNFPAAEASLRRSLEILGKALGPQHADLATALTSLGELELDRGQASRAVPLLERALAILGDKGDRAETQSALTRARAALPH